MTKYILAHDLGTSGNKATLFSEEGQLIASVTHPYPTHYFNMNWAEQEPKDWWQAVCDSTRQLLATSRIAAKEIAVVCFSGHMLGCLVLDRQGQPLRPHILWSDFRATEEAEELNRKLTAEKFYRISGHRSSASYGVQKLMWIKKHEPEIYEQVWKFVNAKDWLAFKLTGELYSEPTDATSTTAYDLLNGCWSEEIITAAEVDPDKFPELIPSTTVIGAVTAEAAQATGLAKGTPVVIGGGDGLCATVGTGCVTEDVMYSSFGTSAWISFMSPEPLYDQQMRTFNWAHIIPGYVCPCGTMQSAGSSFSWLKNELGKLEVEQAARDQINVYQLIECQIRPELPGANGVMFLPYMQGERSPWWNPHAKGTFIGLKLENRVGDLYQAAMEGITLNLGIVLDIFREHGYHFDAINLIGGGAKSKMWCQMMADIWNIQINRLNFLEEATSMGAAVCGGVGAGLYADFDMIDQYIKIQEEFRPIPERVAVYEKMKPVFEQVYHALEPIFPKI